MNTYIQTSERLTTMSLAADGKNFTDLAGELKKMEEIFYTTGCNLQVRAA